MNNLEKSEPDLRVLVVEDDYVIAADLAEKLCELGIHVVGPVPSVEAALGAIDEHEGSLDAAILDINLGSHTVYPVASALHERGIPFIFATGYDPWSIPSIYALVPKCLKPVDPAEVLRCVRGV